ncbi:putative transcriptional regulatory protein C1327,01c [Talaromyces islandicus]|uniref:Putative transcriptional regulatory protein C1327,01c n=1 Tax=Talaromyces islandicus TaxID=28573 RepID=A0A0U1M9X7_TALIS|nr:putative transcriptional regulatory protein C1327,01c [Talaromyces islandicus]
MPPFSARRTRDPQQRHPRRVTTQHPPFRSPAQWPVSCTVATIRSCWTLEIGQLPEDVMGEPKQPASCLICRRRKIKCDRTPGSCNKCRAFGEQCMYASEAATDVGAAASANSDGVCPSDSITQAGLKRRRVLRSCLECKRTKAKCSGGPVCSRCAKKGMNCLFYEQPEPGLREEPVFHKSSRSMPTWLATKNLPSIEHIRELIDIYFAQIHTVRCMGFLHIPSFMERFNDPRNVYSEVSGLIYIMCALAAPFYYAKLISAGEEDLAVGVRFFDAGKGWAESAMQCVFSNYGNPSMECLMTEILLHEHYLRSGDYTKGFLISGSIARRVQLLHLNMENDYDLLCQKGQTPWSFKESRRRLLWACYLLDASIECGIDQLRFTSSDDAQIQLPCTDDLFIRNTPCVTEMLPRGKILPFVDVSLATRAADNVDMRGYYIRAIVVRSKILRYVKNMDGEIPWQSNANSQFYQLDSELRDLENSITESLKMSPENIYIYKASGRLNLFFGLHILIHQTFNDLYRVGVPKLVSLNSATKWIQDNAPSDFTAICHRTCVSKAVQIGNLLRDLWNCHKPSLVDLPYAVHTQICSSVLVTSLTSWTESEPILPQFSHRDYQDILQTNARILKYLQRYIKADLYYESANQALRRFNSVYFSSPQLGSQGRNSISASSTVIDSADNNTGTSPSQFSLEYILNPLGAYPVPHKHIYGRHRSESSESTVEPGLAHSTGRSSPEIYSPATDSVSSHEEAFFPSPDWGTEIPIMDGMGYPTFLEQAPVGA